MKKINFGEINVWNIGKSVLGVRFRETKKINSYLKGGKLIKLKNQGEGTEKIEFEFKDREINRIRKSR